MTEQDWTFASDNCAGAHPAMLDAIVAANAGHAPPYGDDDLTARALELLRAAFGERSQAALVFNGTAANVLAIRLLLGAHEAVITPASAHLGVDEGGAPERFLGAKLYTLPTADGKLSLADVDVAELGGGDVHAAQPGVLSISQPTELGTVYTQAELRDLIDHAHRQGLRVHVDGARLANAAAALGASLAAVSGDAGADAVSFGGTKNGLLGGEAVVVFGDEHARALRYVQKQGMQLASKMRFLSAQFGRAPGRRPLAPERGARERARPAARRRGRAGPRPVARASGGGERGVRHAAGGSRRAVAWHLRVRHLDPSEHRALDDVVGDDRRRRRRLRGGGARGSRRVMHFCTTHRAHVL